MSTPTKTVDQVARRVPCEVESGRDVAASGDAPSGTGQPEPRNSADQAGRYARFCRNLEALYRVDPGLAARIDPIPDERWVEVMPTRSGEFTCRMVRAGDEAGEGFYGHSRYDPRAEAARLIEQAPVSEKFCFIVLGCGLGYHVAALYERLRGESCLIVVEPSDEMLATALTVVDLSEAIGSGRVVFLSRVDKSTLHEKLRPFNTLMMLGAHFVAHPPSLRAREAFFAEARSRLTDFVAYSRMTLLTLVGNAEITSRNIAYNLPRYLSSPGVDELRGRFRGRPAIVISGGPSLRKNVELLGEAKGRAVLIAVQSLLKPMLDRGIEPDFVTALDFHSISKQFFQGLGGRCRVHMVAEPKVTWHVPDVYDGPVSFLHSAFAELLVGPELARRDGLRAGATVAHLAFYLAEYLGCDPIVLVGQDLAFTGHCFYVPGVEAHETWRSEINRFRSMETLEWERIARNRAILKTVPDAEGRTLYTDELLMTYLEQFERDFSTCRARVIDATEGGARKRGTAVMALREVLDRYCGESLPADAFSYRARSDGEDGSKLAAGRREVAARREEVLRIVEVCDEMLGLIEELKGLTDDPDRFNERLVRVDALRAQVEAADRAYRIVNATTQLAELQRFSADRRIAADKAEGAERARRQLERDDGFVRAIREGAIRVADMLDQTLGRFDARMGGGGGGGATCETQTQAGPRAGANRGAVE